MRYPVEVPRLAVSAALNIRGGAVNIDALSGQVRGGSGAAEATPSTAVGAAEFVHWDANGLWRRVAHECEAMADHAYGTGLTIPEETALLIDEALAIFGRSPFQNLPPARQLTRDGGDERPEDGTAGTQPNSVALLSKAHAALAMIIKPATPEAVLLLIEERRKRSAWYALGPLPIVRQMLGLAILSLLMMLVVSLSSDINVQNMSKTLLQLHGLTLLKIEIFLLSAASLGSCFQNLQQINALISAGNYDPKFQSTYWMRWVMGIISGIVLSQLIFHLIGSLSGSTNTDVVMPAVVEQPVLALLGGYSVDVVHGLLSHIINTIGNFFRIPSSAPNEENAVDAAAAAAAARERLAIATEVSELRDGLGGDMSSEEILRRFDDMVRRNISGAR
jgi:hypothetical protein